MDAKRRRAWAVWARRAALLLAAALVYAMIPAAPERALAPEPGREIWLVDHGFHVGLLLPRAALEDTPMAGAAPGAAWFEIGWGDEAFYLRALETAETPLDLAPQALLWPTPSVLHVGAFAAPPPRVFAAERLLRLPADAGALAALRRATLAALTDPPERIAGGLYGGASAFYRGRGAYSVIYVCNHWLSDALRAAGYPTTWFWSTAPAGLFAELRWRGAADPP
ncbi:MAG: DUF2459 domain-containing protein [Pseudomonadota bacterium]